MSVIIESDMRYKIVNIKRRRLGWSYHKKKIFRALPSRKFEDNPTKEVSLNVTRQKRRYNKIHPLPFISYACENKIHDCMCHLKSSPTGIYLLISKTRQNIIKEKNKRAHALLNVTTWRTLLILLSLTEKGYTHLHCHNNNNVKRYGCK